MTALCKRTLALAAVVTFAACHDFTPTLDVDLDIVSSDVTTTAGTDSITGYVVTDSAIYMNGVMYAAVSCDGISWDGDRHFGSLLSVTVNAYPGGGCQSVLRRIAYTISVLGLEPGTYHLNVAHDEPASPRGLRVVFTGAIEVR